MLPAFLAARRSQERAQREEERLAVLSLARGPLIPDMLAIKPVPAASRNTPTPMPAARGGLEQQGRNARNEWQAVKVGNRPHTSLPFDDCAWPAQAAASVEPISVSYDSLRQRLDCGSEETRNTVGASPHM